VKCCLGDQSSPRPVVQKLEVGERQVDLGTCLALSRLDTRKGGILGEGESMGGSSIKDEARLVGKRTRGHPEGVNTIKQQLDVETSSFPGRLVPEQVPLVDSGGMIIALILQSLSELFADYDNCMQMIVLLMQLSEIHQDPIIFTLIRALLMRLYDFCLSRVRFSAPLVQTRFGHTWRVVWSSAPSTPRSDQQPELLTTVD